MSAIKIDNLVKRWDGFTAVDNISFEMGEAEFVALLGPSGCGKSTTLRLIAGLEDPTSGVIEIAGKDVTNIVAAKRNLSMVFQSYALFPHLNVGENILFGLSVRRVSKAEQKRRLDETAQLLGLTPLLDRKPSQLSGGQQQRVALGRALISQTKICLLDEPLSNLDAKLRAEMRNEIRSLQKRLFITMVFVTHDQTEAMSMADRVILMKGGKVEQAGAPAELYEKPASSFVAAFIGTPPMNLLDLDASGAGTSIAGTSALVTKDAKGNALQLGIRPEHIILSDKGLPAIVENSEYFGADSIVTCLLGTQRINLRVPGPPSLTAGAEVKLQWPASAMHFFDKQTTLRRNDVDAVGQTTTSSEEN
ncbi:ABC transporter ATP-binding protein [Devosia sp. 2618]|uniref:ABC transporter ATP-binding protein n=1 Tax=Devosia sp. 2618 TaxID=3156454 RepID=UPI0033971B6C